MTFYNLTHLLGKNKNFWIFTIAKDSNFSKTKTLLIFFIKKVEKRGVATKKSIFNRISTGLNHLKWHSNVGQF
jgi:hypothetical protein